MAQAPIGETPQVSPEFSLWLPLVAVVVMAWFLWARACRLPKGSCSHWPMNAGELLAAFMSLLLAGAIGGAIAAKVSSSGSLGGAAGSGELGHSALAAEALRNTAVLASQGLIAVLVLVGLRLRRASVLGCSMGREAGLSSPNGQLPQRSRFTIPKAVAVGALCFIASWPIVQCASQLASFVQQLSGGGSPIEVGHTTLRHLADGERGLWWVMMATTAVIGAPLIEEFAYRGLVQQAFRRIGADKWWSIVIASVMFTAMHLGAFPEGAVLPGIAAIFTLSVVFGYAFERTGTLVAPIVAHAMFNAANLLLAQLDSGAHG